MGQGYVKLKPQNVLFTETVQITGMSSELQGVGRLSDGRVVFVANALPGEVVDVAVVRESDRFCSAEIVHIKEPSEHRLSASCPYYGVCGGCHTQHMDYAYSLELKRQRVFDALSRVGRCQEPNVRPAIACDDPTRTRNKAEYAIDARSGLKIGFRAANSHTVIDIDDCLLQKNESINIVRAVRLLLTGADFAERVSYLVTRTNRKGESQLTFSCTAPIRAQIRKIAEKLSEMIPFLHGVSFCLLKNRPAHALDGSCECVWGKPTLFDQLNDISFELSPQAFFQINPPQTEVLYNQALIAAGLFENKPRDILDIYCGAGTITLSAVKAGASAVGVEIVPPAIENAKSNAERNGLSNRARFICADAAKEIPRLLGKGRHFDAVILDPPRKGADPATLKAICQSGIPTIAYVSCDPGTLARDVRILTENGYALQWAQPVDMFPLTSHIETVACLVRNNVN